MDIRTFLILFAITFSITSNAELLERLNGEAFYDTDRDVTWIADARPVFIRNNTFGVAGINPNSGGMTWATALNWIAGMNAAKFLGESDWRLPTALNADGSGPCRGVGICNDSEMGHLQIIELVPVIPNPVQVGATNYWYRESATAGEAWVWNFGDRSQFTADKNQQRFAIAVRDGDIGVALPPDIALSNVRVTQAVFDSDLENDGRIDLVKGRSTAILVDIEYTNVPSQQINVEARLSDGTMLASDTLSISGTGMEREFPLIFTPTSEGNQEIIIELESANRKEKDVRDVSVFTTSGIEISFVPLQFSFCALPDCGLQKSNLDSFVGEANNFVRQTYPIPDDGIVFAPNPSADPLGSSLKEAIDGGVRFEFPTLAFPIVLRNLDVIALNMYRIDRVRLKTPVRSLFSRVIGIVPPEFFQRFGNPNQAGAQIPQGAALGRGNKRTALVSISAGGDAVAHELGHTFGLPVNPNSDGEEYSDAIPGRPADGYDPYNLIRKVNKRNFMGISDLNVNEYWVNTETWESLGNTLSKDVDDPSLIYVAFFITDNDNIAPLPWFEHSGLPTRGNEGSYKIQLIGKNEKILQEYLFEPDFRLFLDPGGAVPLDKAMIVADMQYDEETEKIQIINNLDEIIFSVDPVFKVISDYVREIASGCNLTPSLVEVLNERVELIIGDIEAGNVSDTTLGFIEGIAVAFENIATSKCNFSASIFNSIEDAASRTRLNINRLAKRFDLDVIPLPGDLDRDNDVDRADLNILLAGRDTVALGTDDPRDLDGDGMITALDARKLTLLCTRPRCATE